MGAAYARRCARGLKIRVCRRVCGRNRLLPIAILFLSTAGVTAVFAAGSSSDDIFNNKIFQLRNFELTPDNVCKIIKYSKSYSIIRILNNQGVTFNDDMIISCITPKEHCIDKLEDILRINKGQSDMNLTLGIVNILITNP